METTRMHSGNHPVQKYQGPLRAVILDWAGTTVDFGSLAPVRTLQQVFATAGIALAEPEARKDMGLPKKEHIRQILSLARVRDEWTRLHGHTPAEPEVERLYQDFIPRQFSCLLEYSALIPGVLEATERFRKRGLKIGTTTGYTREMLELLLQASEKAGFVPDNSVVPGDVGGGRPHPYMIYENAIKLQVYPLAAIVKIGDTPADIQEGLNAGAWSVGVAATGNMIGLSQEDFAALSAAEKETRIANARAELQQAGAHYVVDSLADVDAVLDEIETHLQSKG